MSKKCWYCDWVNEHIADNFEGDFRCEKCNVENDCLGEGKKDWIGENNNINPATTEEEWLNQEEGEGEMGELGKRAKEKSPFIRLAIGESSESMIYKSWKEIVTSFGNDAFRYAFEVNTEKGLVQKTFDCPQQHFAMQMDLIPFGAKVVIHRKQKVDGNGSAIEGKSIYEAEEIKE